MNTLMDANTTVSGEQIVGMDKEHSNGQVEQRIPVSSVTIEDMVKEGLSMLMVPNIQVNGETTRGMVRANFHGSMALPIKVISEMTPCTVKEYSRGKANQVTRDHGDITRKMAGAR